MRLPVVNIKPNNLNAALAASLTSIALLTTPMKPASAIVEPSVARPAVQTSNARRINVEPAATSITKAVRVPRRGRKQQGDDSVFPTTAQHSSQIVAEPPPLPSTPSSSSSVRAATSTTASIRVSDPRLRGGRIVDAASMIDDSQLKDIGSEISRIEKEVEGSQVLVVTMDDVPEGQTPKRAATELFNRWGIGSKKTQNGVLILVVKDARRVEIEVGLGLEDRFDNAWCTSMLKSEVVPLFKQGRYGDGVYEGVRNVASRLQGGGQAYEHQNVKDIAGSVLYLGLSVLGGGGGGGGGDGESADGGSSSGDAGGGADW